MDPRDTGAPQSEPHGDDAPGTAGQEDGAGRGRRRRRNRRGERAVAAHRAGPEGSPAQPAPSGAQVISDRPEPAAASRAGGTHAPRRDPVAEQAAAAAIRTGVPYIQTLSGKGLSGSPRVPNGNGEVPIRPDNRTLPDERPREVCVARRYLLPEGYPVQYRPFAASRRLMVVASRGDGAELYCDGSHQGAHRWPDQWPDDADLDAGAANGDDATTDQGANEAPRRTDVDVPGEPGSAGS
jgi:hypothetical protein